MSNTDDLAEKKTTVTEDVLQTQSLTAKPLHRQFSTILFTLLLTIIIALVFVFTLFYQQSERSRFVVDSELTPLKQQFKQLQALHKAETLVNTLLFTDSGKNFVELQAELIAVNRQLLRLGSTNTHLYQQWLNANKATSDIVMRIQQSHGRNEQLKQSSIIQLQLMWFSISPIINNKTAQQELLFKQLTAENIKGKLTFSRANAYVNGIRQLHNLQQLKSLLAEVLTGFEQMTLHTSIDDFELLRLGVKQILAQGNTLKTGDTTKAMVDFNQQIDTFEKIVLTEQRALAKWQGYVRLGQSYQLDLTMQKDQLMQILSEPQAKIITNASNIFDDWLDKLNLNLSQRALSIILLLAISLSLLIFCYLLWRLREQIKTTAQHGVVLIHKSINAENSESIQANCAETQAIIQQVQGLVKPTHNEQEFQQLLQQCQAHRQVIDEQAQALAAYTEKTNQKQLDVNDQVSHHLQSELQRYKHLEGEVLSFLQHQQAILATKASNNKASIAVQLPTLIPVYEQLKQFYLASDICSENTVLTLSDVNLVDEIHAILMNKQAEQQIFNNHLYFSCDEQILIQAKIDFRLFNQLMNLLIDLALVDCRDAQLHLHLQLQDKSVGQQLVHFVVKVSTKAIEVLPNLVTQLIDDQAVGSQESPLVDMLNTLFVKQHGENIIAQLIDDGYQLGFELPLAIASSSVVKEQQETTLDGTKAILLSNNAMLAELVEKFIQSASGQLDVLNCIGDFDQQITEEHLSKHKIDILILASDLAQTKLDSITQQLNCLPISLQPKLMLLQSAEINCDRLGFYSQPEQLLFKGAFLHNIETLLTGEDSNNLLLSSEQCQQSHFLANELPVLLAVNTPQQYQNFQRLLCWLGFQVHVVSHADAQRERWETGLYCILFTEFSEASLLKMASKPLVDIGIFSLTDVIPNPENNAYFDGWHIGQLVEESTLTELISALVPWLQNVKSSSSGENPALALPEKFTDSVDDDIDENIDECVITEVVANLAEDNNESAFNFSQYLHHQGSVELALFMLDDYAQDNHQQLDLLVNAIKGKDFDKAKEATTNLQLNAKILAATELEQLCSQWSKLLNGNEIPSSLKEVNILLKETRTALVDIDSYAESI